MKVKYIAALALLLIGSMMITPVFAVSVPEIKVAKNQPPQCMTNPIDHLSGKRTMISGSYSGSIGSFYLIKSDSGTQLVKAKAGVMYGTASFKNVPIPSDSKSIDFCVGRSMSEPVRGSFTYQIHYK